MSDSDKSRRDIDAQSDTTETVETQVVNSTYKVLGNLDADNGVGVLGQNDASSGTPIGVAGAVPYASGGYGLSTPDDARIGGVLNSAGSHTLTVDSVRTLELGATGTDKYDNTAGGNVIAGFENNGVQNDAVGASVAGGGASGTADLGGSIGVRDNTNEVTGNYGTIGGGLNNRAAFRATVGGGYMNTAEGYQATIAGGAANIGSGQRSTVSGGYSNTSSDLRATVSGGGENSADGGGSTISGGNQNAASGTNASVGGGYSNTASASGSTVGGGSDNTASGAEATIGGGRHNDAIASHATIAGGGSVDGTDTTGNAVYDNYGTISGGGNNQAGSSDSDPTTAPYATVGGGEGNTASGEDSTVGGGEGNTAGDLLATVAGGFDNAADGSSAFVGGGSGNTADDSYATVAGGSNNTASGYRGAVIGGTSNTASGLEATVGGGFANTASGEDSTVPGGQNCTADGNYSFASGRLAETNGNGGTFVFGDSSSTTVQASQSDQVVFQAGGTRTSGTAIEFYSQSDGSAGVKLAANDGTWQSLSSRAAKADVDPVEGPNVLANVDRLPISTWRYDGQNESVRHMGPMAEDFHDVFGLGTDEETVAALDLAGVALAAIKGLSADVDERDRRINEQAERIEELEAENEELKDRLAALEAQVGTASAPADD